MANCSRHATVYFLPRDVSDMDNVVLDVTVTPFLEGLLGMPAMTVLTVMQSELACTGALPNMDARSSFSDSPKVKRRVSP